MPGLILLLALLFPAAAQAAPIPYSADYAAVKAQLTTPQAIAEYLTAYFTYDPHYGNTPYPQADFNARRGGDCKDYSAFFSDVLASHGYTVNQYAFRYDTANNYGHIVSIFNNTDGQQYIATNKASAEVIYGPVTSLDQAGALCVANGVLPANAVHDNWMAYPAGFTGYMAHTYGIVYASDYEQAKSQLPYFFHPAIYMAQFFAQQAHPGAYAHDPATLNTLKAGDAKDFAVFHSMVSWGTLHSFRYNQRTNASHVISVKEYDGQYYFQSNRYFFGPVATFPEMVAVMKTNGHIPADCTVDNWKTYPRGYLGPFPVANMPTAGPALRLLLQ